MAQLRPAALEAALAAHWAEHQQRAQRSTEHQQPQAAAPRLPEPQPEPEPTPPAPAAAAGAEPEAGSDGSDDGSDVCDFLGDIGGDSSDDDANAGWPARAADGAAEGAPSSAAAAGPDTLQLVRLIAAALGRPPRVLDIGCGDGALLLQLHESEGLPWSHLAGITADEPAAGEWDLRTSAAHAEARACVALGDFERGAAGAAPGGGFNWAQRFDLVVSWHTFHHLLDPLGALQTAHGLLSAGGILAIQGVPIDTIAPVEAAGDADGGPETADDDVRTIQKLVTDMRTKQGAKVSALVDPASVSRDWIRRGRVFWLQQRCGEGSLMGGLVSYDDEHPLEVRFGFNRARYRLDPTRAPEEAVALDGAVCEEGGEAEAEVIVAAVAEWLKS